MRDDAVLRRALPSRSRARTLLQLEVMTDTEAMTRYLDVLQWGQNASDALTIMLPVQQWNGKLPAETQNIVDMTTYKRDTKTCLWCNGQIHKDSEIMRRTNAIHRQKCYSLFLINMAKQHYNNNATYKGHTGAYLPWYYAFSKRH